MTDLAREYLWIELDASDVADKAACEKCKKVYAAGEIALTDEYGSYFCHAGCAEAWEQDRAEADNEARHSGEGGTTEGERRDQMAGWLKGRR